MPEVPVRAYLSLGSNIEPERHLASALQALRARFGTLQVSPIYRTRAVGFAGDDFLNAAVGLRTDLQPGALNDWLHALEEAHGRDRSAPRWSSRTLDVDILLYGDRVVSGPGNLEVPRTELAEQAFVLKPMVDIAPDLVHPVLGKSLRALWAAFPHPVALQRVDTPLG